MSARQLPTGVDPLPDDIESPRAKLVYLYLHTSGGATVERIQAALGLPRITLFSILGTLRERGLVDYDDGRYDCTR